MDWPIDMPFPIFYKKWQMRMAENAGGEAELKRRGLPFTWETMKALKKSRDSGNDRWERDNLEKTTPQAMAIEEALFEHECRTFILSTPLISALKQTANRDIPQDLVKVPFSAIYLDLSSSGITIANPVNKRTSELRGVLVIDQNNETHKNVCRVTLNPPKTTLIGYTIHYQPGDTDGQGRPVRSWSCNAMVWCATNGSYNNPAGDGDFAIVEDPLHPEAMSVGKMARTDSELWRLWINALLYINSVSADIREEWLHKKAAAKLKGKKGKSRRAARQHVESGGKVFRVGHYIHIPQISDGEKKAARGGKIGVRFLVRGHWHTYWTGSNRLGNRKQVLKWLAPYWKGPDTADVVHGTYVVSQPSQKGEAHENRDADMEKV